MEAHEMERRLSDVIKGCVLPSLRKQQNTNVPETCCWWNGIEMFVVWTWSELHPRRVTHVHSWCSVYYSCYFIIRCITVYQSVVTTFPRIPLDGLHVPSSSWTEIMRWMKTDDRHRLPEQQQNQHQASRRSSHGHSLDRSTMMSPKYLSCKRWWF